MTRSNAIALAFLLVVPGRAPGETSQVTSLTRAQFVAAMDVEFRKLDLDKNNLVTSAEILESERRIHAAAAVQRLNGLFKQLVRDNDGKLGLAEFQALAAENKTPVDPTPILARFDANKNDQIEIVEYRASTQANFDRVDADRDGTINPEEMKSAGLLR